MSVVAELGWQVVTLAAIVAGSYWAHRLAEGLRSSAAYEERLVEAEEEVAILMAGTKGIAEAVKEQEARNGAVMRDLLDLADRVTQLDNRMPRR